MATASSLCGVILWHYYSSSANTWIPYPPDISSELEQRYKSGHSSHSININTNKLTVCFRSFTQTGGARSHGPAMVQRLTKFLPMSPPIMGYWQWDSGRGAYLCYSLEATVQIETHYQSMATGTSTMTTLDLSTTPAAIPYTIDFNNLTQMRHHYNTIRSIRRVSLTIPLQELLSDGGTPKSGTAAPSFLTPAGSVLAGKSTKRIKAKVLHKSTPAATGAMVSTVTTSSSGMVTRSKSSKPNKRSKKGTVSPPPTSAEVMSSQLSSDNPLFLLKDFIKTVTSLNFGEDGPCPICMNELSEMSGFEEDVGISTQQQSESSSLDLCKLKKCGHLLHRACLIMYTKNSTDAKGCIRCPTCKVIHGIKRGDMPTTGNMSINTRPNSLPGHEGYGTVEIIYNFRQGVLPNGKRYSANGFPRICYLPDTPKGRKVLKLLKVAWERGLTFTVGTSVTTGATDTIVWNEIHHKTESHSNYSGHGYPDPNYLDNVLGELAAQGVVDEEEDTQTNDNKNYSSSDSDL